MIAAPRRRSAGSISRAVVSPKDGSSPQDGELTMSKTRSDTATGLAAKLEKVLERQRWLEEEVLRIAAGCETTVSRLDVLEAFRATSEGAQAECATRLGVLERRPSFEPDPADPGDPLWARFSSVEQLLAKLEGVFHGLLSAELDLGADRGSKVPQASVAKPPADDRANATRPWQARPVDVRSPTFRTGVSGPWIAPPPQQESSGGNRLAVPSMPAGIKATGLQPRRAVSLAYRLHNDEQDQEGPEAAAPPSDHNGPGPGCASLTWPDQVQQPVLMARTISRGPMSVRSGLSASADRPVAVAVAMDLFSTKCHRPG